jgi:GR25 family glycosyltransferase involved in LPS biosynthesis
MVSCCLILNLDYRKDLWDNLSSFRKKWESHGKHCVRIPGITYKNKQNVLNDLIIQDRINLNGAGFRKRKDAFIGEMGCFNGHYSCWKYIVENKIDSCLILEDGIEFLREDFDKLKMNSNIDLMFVNSEMKLINSNFIGFGLQGYVVSLNGAKILTEKCKVISAPVDLQVRELCNSRNINASVLSNTFVRRNNNRNSSIEGLKVDDQGRENDKQDMMSIINRVLTNLIKKNVNLDDYLE